MQKFMNCAYHCAQMSYTTQHTAVLIIFPLILHTGKHQSSDAVYTGGKRGHNTLKSYENYQLTNS